MSDKKLVISPENFYGKNSTHHETVEAITQTNEDFQNFEQPKFMKRLLGPSTTWKVFKKQEDAINCCLHRRNGLMPFAFEDVNGRRMFLSAHPKVFWALNFRRFFKNCSSYEIIQEYSACKLYLDIEFEYEYNKNKNGERMLKNVLKLINFNFKEHFNILCTRSEVLDLDSSSNTKFSHHIIYEIKNVAFQHNYAVGSFIKKICNEIKEAYECNSSGESSKLQKVIEKYNVSPEDVLELFIQDHKGKTKLLIDEGVYTKNRHFRLLGSAKKAKNIPLIISKENKYKPNESSNPLNYFLDSLITYFSWEVNRVLDFEEPGKFKALNTGQYFKPTAAKSECLLYPEIDSFINSLIFPKGRIRRKAFFSESSTLVYDIQGFRYCKNIEREHKSNNIKYIVDLRSLKFYQKCYDPDCADFHSQEQSLPDDIYLLFLNDTFLAKSFDKCLENEVEATEEKNFENKFEESISDEDLEKIIDCTEAMFGVNW